MNYPRTTTEQIFPILAAFDSGGLLLEAFDVQAFAPIIFSGGGNNEGEFRGINRATADIAYVELSGRGAVFDNFRFVVETDPVPEPTTVLLLGIGLVGLAGAEVRRRRKKKAVDNT